MKAYLVREPTQRMKQYLMAVEIWIEIEIGFAEAMAN